MTIEAENKKFEVEYDGNNENETELAFKALHEFLDKFQLETDVCDEDEEEENDKKSD